MKTTTLLLAGLALAIALPAAVASARETTITGPGGVAINRDVDRVPGGVDSTTTGPRGGTIVRNLRRTPDGAFGTVTGPRGRVITREVTR